MSDITANMAAFLSMISHSEGTDRAADPYRVCFGFKHTIVNLANHPAMTGEWNGEPIDFLGPQYKGQVSTAAGRYQLTRPTWIYLLTKIYLPDFGPNSQDAAATQLIKDKHALDLVEAGNIGDAIIACRTIWASLPGNSYGQPQKTSAELMAYYTTAGGAFA